MEPAAAVPRSFATGPLVDAQLVAEHGLTDADRTPPQIIAANDACHRAHELVKLAALLNKPGTISYEHEYAGTVPMALRNLGLAHARVLAEFLNSDGKWLNVSWYGSWRDDDLAKLCRAIVRGASPYLQPRVVGSAPIPFFFDDWPIAELAVALVGGLARFVEALDETRDRGRKEWFEPSPTLAFEQLTAMKLLSPDDEISNVPHIERLAIRLRLYLDVPTYIEVEVEE